MPIKSCGKGVKWGNHGKCYKGKNKRAKAKKQMRAAFANGYRGK
jgi:hypothetical protein